MHTRRQLDFSLTAWGLTVLLTLAAALFTTSVEAAGTAAESARQARHQQERTICLNGLSNQDRATCLREADAAFAQAQRGDLRDRNTADADYARNARQRCERLQGEDRANCMARMQGQGSTSGSAAGGGILRELVVTQPASAAAAASAASAPPSSAVK